MLGGETGKITFGKLNINLGFRAKRIPSWYNILVHWEGADFSCCCKVYDSFCHAEGFGLLLVNGCDRIAALTRFEPKKNPLKLSAYINRTTVYA
jgi:hypothetical protein